MNKILKKIAILCAVIIIVTGCSYKQDKTQNEQKPQEDQNQIILYYGDTCPHCKIVEKYLLDNKVADKLKIVQKEIFNNMENASDMAERASICKLDIQKIGVPFLYYQSKCYMGDQEVISFFENKLKSN